MGGGGDGERDKAVGLKIYKYSEREREKEYRYMGQIYRNKVEIENSRAREEKGKEGVRNSETER